MHYYKRHLGDYAKDTRHLTMLQHGAFTLLLDWYYSSERPLPIDRCDRIANAGTPAEREAVQFVLRDFFLETSDGYISRRADKEIAAMQEKSGKAANSAKARWDNNHAMRTHSERIANAMPSQCEGNASHYPLSTIHKEQEQKQEHAPQAALPTKPKRADVGHRIPDDWSLTPELEAYCRQKRPDLDPHDQAERFALYWRAKAGKEARKTDWNLTYMTWIRNAHRNGGSHANSTPSRKLSAVEQVEHAIAERKRRESEEFSEAQRIVAG